jgi:phytoene dehydrogenase-like protein
MEKSIIIIGAGVAGLAAGCYGQMNGFRTEIFELHDLPGGLCTAWERKDYILDGCIHYLYGSAPGQPFNRLWQELGAIEDTPIINHTEFMQAIAPDGQRLIAYCDPDRLEQHLLELSLADRKLIHSLTDGIRQFMDFDMSLILEQPRELMGLLDWMKLGMRMLPFVPATAKFGLLDAQGLAQKFKDPFLRKAFPHLFAWPEIPMIAALSGLAYMQRGNAGFPAGGSLELARRLEKRYVQLGGKINYKAQVQKILVENRRAVGVRLYNDDEYRADYVISTADGRGTIHDLLDGQYIDRKIQDRYKPGDMPVLTQLLVSYGVQRDLSSEPHWATYLLDEPLLIGGREHSEIGVKHYCFDPSLAPAGHSVVEVMLRTDYDYWQRIYGRKLYDTEQDQVADQVLAFLEKLYPGISGEVEVVDVATPLSYERYTGNWLGATCGWLLTKRTMPMMVIGMRKTLPGLGNFYLAGQWVEPGGSLPSCAYSGRNALRLICEAEGRKFRSETV